MSSILNRIPYSKTPLAHSTLLAYRHFFHGTNTNSAKSIQDTMKAEKNIYIAPEYATALAYAKCKSTPENPPKVLLIVPGSPLSKNHFGHSFVPEGSSLKTACEISKEDSIEIEKHHYKTIVEVGLLKFICISAPALTIDLISKS